MRSRNELERLAAAGRPLLADAESLVDPAEEDRILARILAGDRAAARAPRRPWALVAVGVAVVAAAVVAASLELDRSTTSRPTGNQHVALTGAKIELAGFHFRTPAGFKRSDSACAIPPGPGAQDGTNGFAAAASAEGGCLGAFFLIAEPGASTPADEGATPVPVGDYSGYFVAASDSNESTLYVQLPTFESGLRQFLELDSEGLTEQQLVAIARSGLPGDPAAAANLG